MELKRIHWIGIIVGVALILISIVLYLLYHSNPQDKYVFLLFGLGIVTAIGPIVLSAILESSEEKEKDEMFIEFTRDLVESVKAGTPIVKSIVNFRNKPYGTLSPHIRKLANQVSLGIPIQQALRIFARDVNNVNIARAITLIGEAERAGGDIGRILESVAISITEINKLRKERRSAIYGLVVQGYIIFIIFMAIILVMQFKILPMVEGIGNIGAIGSGSITSMVNTASTSSNSGGDVSQAFFILLIVQGIFSGIFIGKLSEGTFKAGFKHSFILAAISFFVFVGAKFFTGARTAI